MPPTDQKTAPPESRDTEMRGEVIDERFRLEEILGEGGLGRVWRATQLSVDRDVAVKVLRGQVQTDEQFRKRFLREAQVISGFNHPNIVRLIDFGEDGERGFSYLVMELVDGIELTDLGNRGRFRADFALEIVYQVAAGLLEAHNAGIIHRDLKLENLFAVPVSNGKVQIKVLDFGVALPKNTDSRMTTAGQVFGTPAYMSPEQAEAKDVGPESDLYSLGVLLFEMLTGQLPFTGGSSLKIMMKHLEAEPPSLSEFLPAPTIPAGVPGLLDDLMAKSPDDRPGDAREVRTRIERIRRDADIDPVRVDPTAESDAIFDPFILAGNSGQTARHSGAVIPDTGSSKAPDLRSDRDPADSLELAATAASPPADTADSDAPSRQTGESGKSEPWSTRRALKAFGGTSTRQKLFVAIGIVGALGLAGGLGIFMLSSENSEDTATAQSTNTSTEDPSNESAAEGPETAGPAGPDETADSEKSAPPTGTGDADQKNGDDPEGSDDPAGSDGSENGTDDGASPPDPASVDSSPSDGAKESGTSTSDDSARGAAGADESARPADDGTRDDSDSQNVGHRAGDGDRQGSDDPAPDGSSDDGESTDGNQDADEDPDREVRENLEGLESDDWSSSDQNLDDLESDDWASPKDKKDKE